MQIQEQMKHVSCNQFVSRVQRGSKVPSALYEHVHVKLALADLIFIAVNALKPNEQDHLEKYFLKINM